MKVPIPALPSLRIQLVAITIILSLNICSAKVSAAVPPADGANPNGVWLGHAFVTTPRIVATVPATLDFFHANKVGYIFVNVGRLDGAGHIEKGSAAFPRLNEFLAAIGAWEKEKGVPIKVLAWVSGNLDPERERYLDLTQTATTESIRAEASRLVDATIADSYLKAGGRAFDGIQLDLEPSGANAALFENILKLMASIRTGIGPRSLTSFCLHKLGTQNRYFSSSEQYTAMARTVDLICAMTYDNGIKDGAGYSDWMRQQVVDILKAVSAAGPALPTQLPPARVLIGFPAFPANAHHEPAAESVPRAAEGVKAALQDVRKLDPNLTSQFLGAAIYLYTDGSGADHYSARDTDWAAWKFKWLE